MLMRRAAQGGASSLRPLVRAPAGRFLIPRAFAASADPSARPAQRDASRQPVSVERAPPRRKSSDTPTLYVPEVTQEQKDAAEALKKANRVATAAKTAASEAATVSAILKKTADGAASASAAADKEHAIAKKAADEAVAAKRKADENAVEGLKKADDDNKLFLNNAFESFDTGKAGFLTPNQIKIVLESLGLPSGGGDVDDLVQVLDDSKDDVIQCSEWTSFMPREMALALENHPLAKEWAAK